MEGLPLETSRVVIRRFAAHDLDALVAYRRVPEVAEFQDWDVGFDRAKAEGMVAGPLETPISTPGQWTQLAVVDVATGDLLGDIAVHFLADQPATVELGVTFSPEYQGQGLATEALTQVINWLFSAFALHRVFAHVDKRNEAARSLLSRLGFRQEAELRNADWFKGEWTTLCIYAILSNEWLDTPPHT